MYTDGAASGPVPAALTVASRRNCVAKNLSPDETIYLAAAPSNATAASLAGKRCMAVVAGRHVRLTFNVIAATHSLWHWTRGGGARLVLKYD